MKSLTKLPILLAVLIISFASCKKVDPLQVPDTQVSQPTGIEQKQTKQQYTLYRIGKSITQASDQKSKCTALQPIGCWVTDIVFNPNGTTFTANTAGFSTFNKVQRPIENGISGVIVYTTNVLRPLKWGAQRVQTYTDPNGYIQTDVNNVEIPLNTAFHVKVIGLNQCLQTAEYTGDFILALRQPEGVIAEPVMDFSNRTRYSGITDPSVKLEELIKTK